MEAIKDFDPRLAEVDLAYQILKTGGEAQNFRILVQQVFAIKSISIDNHKLMAEIHTQFNIDSRFVFLGQGVWGLKEWNQAKVVRRNIVPPVLGRSAPYHHRSLQDELEHEDGEAPNYYENNSPEEEDEWEE